MNIKLWGVRGSIPTTSSNTKKYGGNTSCVEVSAGDSLLVLDAGSGIQNLNSKLFHNYQRVDILLTHLHMDHIQGLGFFAPLFNPAIDVHIWGPASSAQSLRARLGRYFSPPLFPVYFRNLTCKLFLHELENNTFTIGLFTIHSSYVVHPGPTIGFRIEHNDKVFAYIPDHEFALGCGGVFKDTKWLSGSDLVQNADLLIHDAQYTSLEYENRQGWGHSSITDALEFASLNKVKHLILTHHDPMHSDEQLDDIYSNITLKSTCKVDCEMAVEGSTYEL